MKMRVADYIAQFLEEKGVTAAFLLSGGGMMHLLDAVSRKEKLKYYCNHHEQASAMAAEAYARESGKLGVCYATSGPGGTNTITGVVGAWQDSSPVLFMSGQSKVSQTIRGTGLSGLRQFGTFEVDIVPIVQSITKYAAFVDSASSIRYHLERAFYEATTGRRGPVFLDIPVDVQGAPIEPEKLQGFVPPKDDVPRASVDEIDSILEKLRSAKRPLILAGHGIRCAGQVEEFKALIDRLGVPVITTQLAIDLLTYDHPLFVGHPGMKGDRAGNFAVQSADCLLILGSSLHVVTTGYELDRFSPDSYKIMVDPDEWILKREAVGVQKKIRSDLGELIRALADRFDSAEPIRVRSEWAQHCQLLKQDLAVSAEPHRRIDGKIHYYDVIEELSKLTKGEETITTDAGSAFYVVGQAFKVKGNQRVIVSGALGTMGFALPAATGAALASPDKTVICLTGDGSLQTNIHELAVLRQNKLNVKVIVVNNDGYVSIRNTQNNFFAGHLAGTSRSSGVFIPDLDKLSAAYELPYVRIEKLTELHDRLGAVLNQEGPVVCEIFTPAEQEIIPTVTSVRKDDGSMESKPLHDMYPFWDQTRVKKYLKKD